MKKSNDIPSPIFKPSRNRGHGGIRTHVMILAALTSGLACSQAQLESMRGPRIAASTHLASAGMLERQNNHNAAIKQYEEAIESDPKLVQAYFGLGRLHFKLKQFEEAALALARGAAAQCDVPSVHNNLGFTYLQQRKYEDAERSFRRALELSPHFVRARMNLAITLARMDRINDSIDQFSEIVPQDDAYFNIAVIRAEENDYAGAAKALKSALATNPAYEPALDHMDRIQRIARAEEAAQAAVARLAARNTLAGFSEPVASASALSPEPCVIPDGGTTERKTASMVLPSGIETREPSLAEPIAEAKIEPAPKPIPAPASDPAKDAAADEGAFVGPIQSDEPGASTGRIVSYSVPCLKAESGSADAIGEPVEPILIVKVEPDCDENVDAPTDSIDPAKAKSNTATKSLTTGRPSKQDKGRIVRPTYTSPSLAENQADHRDD